MADFRNFVERKQADDSTMEMIDDFEKQWHKCKSHRVSRYEKKTAVHLEDRIIGWASHRHIQCNGNPIHTFLLTTCKKVWKNEKKMKTKHRRLIDYPDNLMGVLAPCISRMGPTEVNSIVCMLNLPKSKYLPKNICKYQPVVCKEIINISDREMC